MNNGWPSCLAGRNDRRHYNPWNPWNESHNRRTCNDCGCILPPNAWYKLCRSCAFARPANLYRWRRCPGLNRRYFFPPSPCVEVSSDRNEAAKERPDKTESAEANLSGTSPAPSTSTADPSQHLQHLLSLGDPVLLPSIYNILCAGPPYQIPVFTQVPPGVSNFAQLPGNGLWVRHNMALVVGAPGDKKEDAKDKDTDAKSKGESPEQETDASQEEETSSECVCGDYVILTVVSPDGTTQKLCVSVRARLLNVKKMCVKEGIEEIKFFKDGEQLSDEDTPQKLKLRHFMELRLKKVDVE